MADTGSMAIFGEIDGELSRIDLGVGCRTVDIDSDVYVSYTHLLICSLARRRRKRFPVPEKVKRLKVK